MRVPLRVALALLLGLLMAYADSRTIHSASAKAEFTRLHPCPATGARSGPCGLNARELGLLQVKALAHLRHHAPPARVGEATVDPLDMCVPVTARRVWLLSPQHDVKIFESSIFGNFLFDSQVERDDIDQGTCHECPDGCY